MMKPTPIMTGIAKRIEIGTAQSTMVAPAASPNQS
jgi:hypothetical protein